MYNLWPFQSEALLAINAEFAKGMRRTLVSMPTGTGKTIVLCACVVMALRAGTRCLIIVPTAELVGQTVEKLQNIGIFPGVVKQDRDEWDYPVVVAQFQTLARPQRITRIPPDMFKFILIDEAHQSFAPSFKRIMRYFCTSWFVGFTATPFRGDKNSLALANWHSVAYVYPIDRAIREGWLAKPRVVKVSTRVNLDGIPVDMKQESFGIVQDFRARELEKIVDTPERNEAIVAAFAALKLKERAIAFCVTRRHALDLANTFRAFGIPAGMIHYQSPPAERAAILSAHQRGELSVVTNVSVLSQGYDDPGLGAVIMARPTLSKVVFVQCIGRGLRRLDPSKEYCTILDVVDVCSRHRIAITDEVLDLQHDLSDPSLGIVTAQERGLLLEQIRNCGVSQELAERVAYSDALTRAHYEAYKKAAKSGGISTPVVAQILGLGEGA
jgi:superfamily II DNA or RNA helicase